MASTLLHQARPGCVQEGLPGEVGYPEGSWKGLGAGQVGTGREAGRARWAPVPVFPVSVGVSLLSILSGLFAILRQGA